MRRSDAFMHSKTTVHRQAVDRAKHIRDRALAQTQSWYVAFSAGKDSTCVLALVREALPDAPAVTSVRQWDLPETQALLKATPNIRHVTYNGFNNDEAWVSRWDSLEQAREKYSDIRWLETREEIMARGAHEEGVFLGLRADEAKYRQVHLAVNGPLFKSAKSRKWQCNPIAWWSVRDVWAYILANDLPYNAAYDVMDRMCLPLEDQRVGPFDAALGKGALAILKRGWPHVWNAIAARHPEARGYA